MQPKHISFFDLLQEAKGLSTKAKMVYLLLCFAEAEGREIVGQEGMSRELELSPDSVNRGLKELKDRGFVTWKNRGLTLPSIYQVVRRPGSTSQQSTEGEQQS